LNHKTQSYLRNKYGTHQIVYVAIPNNSTTRQNSRRIRIHTLYLVIRNFRGKALVLSDSKMCGPASLVAVLNAACVIAIAQ